MLHSVGVFNVLFSQNPVEFGLVVVGLALPLGYFGLPLWTWTLYAATLLLGFEAPSWSIATFGVFALISNVPFLRQALISRWLLIAIRALGLIPKVSETEKAALDAGAVWVESEFFSGHPDFKRLMAEKYPELTAEEKAYLEGPIEGLCSMINDWKIYQSREIPEEVWNFMRKIKIFGMIIPKKYGGLEFSALAHSEVIMKLASRSIPVTVTAMVPNSLGPAELLIHFGTEEQRGHYLPKLATGEYIPCFALTEQRAGSDAGSVESNGDLFKKDGKLFIRLNWNKRWITLAGVSNVLGLAFELRDPDKLIGQDYIVGITCALIPSNTPGVVLGQRHDPLGIPFHNCPTQGENVEVPADVIIGGINNAGKGWTMLMECLGAGRGISLPSQSTGGSKVVARITSAHTSIRRQFGIPLCKLEGLEEPLARIAGLTYTLDALRKFTVGALDSGIKPAVVSAIAKYNGTELGRIVVNDGMDIMAGAGISRGPRNIISNIYQATPIGITVEGANILTRTMIVFGQGIFRAHPWAYKEVTAIETGNVAAFDRAVWGHIGHIVRNVFRFAILSLTRARFVRTPGSHDTRRYFQKISWISATFALFSDIAMGVLGGELKKKEKLSGRFADILSWLYLGTAALRRYEAEGRRREDLPFLDYSLRYGITRIQDAFDGIFLNLGVPGLTWFFKWVLRGLVRMNSFEYRMTDEISHQAAKAMLKPGEARDRLTHGIYYPANGTEALGRLENAFRVVKKAEDVERTITQAIGKKLLPKKKIFKLVELAREKNIINDAEEKLLMDSALARWDVCKVDDFTEAAYHGEDDYSDIGPAKREYVGPAGSPQNYKPPKAS